MLEAIFVSVESIRMLEISKGSDLPYMERCSGRGGLILTRGPEDYVDSNDPTYVSYKVGHSEDTEHEYYYRCCEGSLYPDRSSTPRDLRMRLKRWCVRIYCGRLAR